MSHFHLFLPLAPGTDGLAGGLPAGCERLGPGHVRGTPYRLDGAGQVLMLYGDTPVPGEIWRCPAESLVQLDRRAGTAEGRRRRVARAVPPHGGGDPVPCWLYVAGPAVSRGLLPDRRVPEAG